eukprot:TRINITY_DN3033_c0_g1_i1.p1 TRINITY_DN3033_c0_g1~~TRINITY_DN3033_c0_g1_i1.p1  ORF type:complete len:788 (+),score=138.47 TRINITY_DN3033_c0_g1_i1:160-2523(+)
MKVYLQVIGCNQEEPSALLFFDNLRILVNGGEGIQRLCSEHGVRYSKVEHLLLTRLSWDTFGGVPDLIFSMADMGREYLNLYGPKYLLDFLLVSRYFLCKSRFGLSTHEVNDRSVLNFPNEEVQILPIVIEANPGNKENATLEEITNLSFEDCKFMAQEAQDFEEEEEPEQIPTETENVIASSSSSTLHPIDRETQGKAPSEPLTSNPPQLFHENINSKTTYLLYDRPSKFVFPKNVQTALCYVILTPRVPGKMDGAKAVKLGVPKGPLMGKLVKGESVVLPNGTVVSPGDCIGPSLPGPLILIIACPSLNHLPNLISHPVLQKYQQLEDKDQVVCVIHSTPYSIVSTKPYVDWMAKFRPNSQHILMSMPHEKSSKSGGSEYFCVNKSFLELQLSLNSIDPNVFPIPFQFAQGNTIPLPPFFGKNVIFAESMLKYNIQPISSIGFDRSEIIASVPRFVPSKKIEQAIQEYQTQLLRGLDSNPSEAAKLVFLGVGAAIPFKTRNVSSIFLELKRGGVLLDCGESTFTQLHLKYGERIGEILIGLKVIWLSHKHADHHLSLISILTQRRKYFQEKYGDREPCPKVMIFGPRFMYGYIVEYGSFIDMGNYEYVLCSEIEGDNPKWKGFFNSECGLSKFSVVKVPHCYDSYGLIVENDTSDYSYKWKLVYSADTRPCKQLVNAGKDATILIHEATMEDSLQHEAIARSHSTTDEALTISREMNAYRVILTHFSMRHRKYPLGDFLTMEKEKRKHATIAFDLMTVELSEKRLELLPLLLDPLCVLAEEDLAK